MSFKRGMPPDATNPRGGTKEEIAFYLEERAREFEAQGMTPEEAREAAEAAFGDVRRIEAEVRSISRGAARAEKRRMAMGSVIQDVRYALRGIHRQPGFTAVVALTLGIGIGATTAIFSVVNASLIRALPFEDAEPLVLLQGAYDAPEGPQIRGASVPETRDWAEMSHSFEGVAGYSSASLTLTGVDQAVQVQGEYVGQGYFDLLRVRPLIGRTFSTEENALPESHPVALLGEALWAESFGRDEGVIGETLRLDGEAYEVVGVLPESFHGMTLQADLWLPFGASPFVRSEIDTRGSRWLGVLARLAPGATPESAQADMNGLTAQLEEAFPDAHEDRIALVTPLRTAFLGNTRTLMLVILGATGLLLIIAAANVTNLFLVRATARGPEVSLRAALGAGRRRLMTQFFVESLVLATLGAGVGFAVGVWGARALAAAMPAALLPSYVTVTTDLRVFAFAAILLAVAGVASGLAPALLAARAEARDGLRGGLARGRRRRFSLQNTLVVGEVALALMLLIGAGLMTRSFRAQLAVDPGFDAEELMAFNLIFPPERYDADARRAAAADLRARLEGRPEVVAATFASEAPLRDGSSATYLWVDGQTEVTDRIRFYIHRVASGYFETMGVSLRSGRALDETDETPPLATAVISDAMARRHYPGRDPVGETLRVGSPDGTSLTIVGVAEDVRYRDLTTDLVDGATDPDVYIPWMATPSGRISMVARAVGDPAGLGVAVREVVRSVDGDLAVFNDGPMTLALRTETAQGRFGTLLLSVFGTLAVMLAAIGLYGVLAFAVNRRKREMAIRMAVGAAGMDVRRLVVMEGMKLAALGLALGLLGATVAGRSLQQFLFGVQALDPRTYGFVALLMGTIAFGSTYLPARKATQVDPQRVLTAE